MSEFLIFFLQPSLQPLLPEVHRGGLPGGRHLPRVTNKSSKWLNVVFQECWWTHIALVVTPPILPYQMFIVMFILNIHLKVTNIWIVSLRVLITRTPLTIFPHRKFISLITCISSHDPQFPQDSESMTNMWCVPAEMDKLFIVILCHFWLATCELPPGLIPYGTYG